MKELAGQHVNYGTLVPPLEIDLSNLMPIEVPVKLVKRPDGKHSHILVEASHSAAKQYRSASLSGAEMFMPTGGEGSTLKKMEGMARVESLLVSLCLFEVYTNGDGSDHRKPVKLEWVDSLLDRQVKPLFDKIKEISPSLNEGEDLPALLKQRDLLDRRIERLRAADPNDSPLCGQVSSPLLTS